MNPMRRFKERIQDGQICLGSSITFCDPLVTEALSRSVDFIWIDLEHSDMSPEALNSHLLACRASGSPSIVRVKGSGTPFIKPILDAGACGIVVPQIRTADEVRGIVSDCRYPPQGSRGYGPRVPSEYGNKGGRAFADESNRDMFVAVMIENLEALRNLDEILTVEGLDSVVIGPMDLTASMGILGDIQHPDARAAIRTIIRKSREAGLMVGVGLGLDAALACDMLADGVQWIQLGCDYMYLIDSFMKTVSDIQGRLNSAGTDTRSL
jgi:2-keto-3-deoxy-L-rhamnonate aldolase RhmA